MVFLKEKRHIWFLCKNTLGKHIRGSCPGIKINNQDYPDILCSLPQLHFFLLQGKKPQCVIQLRGSLLASCSPLSSRLMPELRGGQGGLPPTLPTQAINCWGFVGGGISPSSLALPAVSTASSQYLSAYSASPPTWTTSLNWLPPYKPMLNDLFCLFT